MALAAVHWPRCLLSLGRAGPWEESPPCQPAGSEAPSTTLQSSPHKSQLRTLGWRHCAAFQRQEDLQHSWESPHGQEKTFASRTCARQDAPVWHPVEGPLDRDLLRALRKGLGCGDDGWLRRLGVLQLLRVCGFVLPPGCILVHCEFPTDERGSIQTLSRGEGGCPPAKSAWPQSFLTKAAPWSWALLCLSGSPSPTQAHARGPEALRSSRGCFTTLVVGSPGTAAWCLLPS